MDMKKFNEIEKKYSLNSKCIDGYNYWTYLRFKYCRMIDSLVNGYDCGFLNDEPKKHKHRIIGKIKKYIRQRKSFREDGDIPKKYVDILFLSNGRRFLEDGYYESPNLDTIMSEYDNCLMYERLFMGEKFRPIQTKNLVVNYGYLSFAQQLLVKIKKKLFGKRWEKKIVVDLTEAFYDISEVFGIKKENLDFLLEDNINGIANYKYEKANCRRVLNRCKPKVIIEECYYGAGYMTFNEVAKEMEIPVVEVQHGAISNNHYAYNFEKNISIRQFPDYFFCDSDYWKKSVNMPIDDNRLIAVGNPYKERKAKELRNNKREEITTVVIISMPSCATELSKIALVLSNSLGEDVVIKYKLHPCEVQDWKIIYKILVNTKVEVIEEDLYQVLSKADYIISMYDSTAVFESYFFDPTVLLKYSMCDTNFKQLCDDGYAIPFEGVEEVINIIKNGIKCNSNPTECFYKQNALLNIKNELSFIMKHNQVGREISSC